MSKMSGEASNTPRQDPQLITNDLDQADVLIFISSLIDQNSDLAGKLERIDTLMKLAEEQVETTRAEAGRIITEAKQIAEQSAQEKVSIAQQQAQEIIKAAEEQARNIIAEARLKAETASKPLSEDKLKETSGRDPKKSHSNPGDVEVKQTVPLSGQEGANEEGGLELYDGTVELVIPPPIAPDRLLKLGRQLRHTRQIRVLNLKGSLVQGIRIRLLLRTPVPLIEILEAIPEVDKVSGDLKKANETNNPPQTRDELSAKSILVRIKK
jgi:vacuolar-type H+-ATPase subunit H